MGSKANCHALGPSQIYVRRQGSLEARETQGPESYVSLALDHFLVPEREDFIGFLLSVRKKRDKDKLWQDPEINPGEADIVSLNVIESPWCLVGPGDGAQTS